jgi:hypothetical protein
MVDLRFWIWLQALVTCPKDRLFEVIEVANLTVAGVQCGCPAHNSVAHVFDGARVATARRLHQLGDRGQDQRTGKRRQRSVCPLTAMSFELVEVVSVNVGEIENGRSLATTLYFNLYLWL